MKNVKKKTKVNWKISKKSKVAKIAAKKSTGKKPYATIEGVKKGTAKLSASYTLGKKTGKLTCKVVVRTKKDSVLSTSVPQQTSAVTQSAVPTGTAVVQSTEQPEATDVPKPTNTPTARPTRKPTAVPTASPTPLPDGNAEFEEVKGGTPIDLSTFNATSGEGAYNAAKKRVEINDSGESQGSFPLTDIVEIKDGDLVTFRVQGYNYGDTGFRFWIETPYYGNCTPIQLTDDVDEALKVGDYPCVVDGQTINQMSLNTNPETKAFDVTFTVKAGESQKDAEEYNALTIKHINSLGHINVLVITGVYYLKDGPVSDGNNNNQDAEQYE